MSIKGSDNLYCKGVQLNAPTCINYLIAEKTASPAQTISEKSIVTPHNRAYHTSLYRAILLLLWLLPFTPAAQNSCSFTIARLRYDGGGDWYANPSSFPNLVKAVREQTSIPICDTIATVSLDDDRLFLYPFIAMTGHGEVRFTPQQQIRLRKYLLGGGFLWADDNYGLDQSFRKEITRLFPDHPLTAIPSDHPIFRSTFHLKGLPKIHEHDGKPAEALTVQYDNRMLVLYTYSSDIGDGMEDPDVHNDGPQLHKLALQMGVNIVSWFFNP